MDDHIAVKIDGVVYVKLEDVKPMRYRIDELEAALSQIARQRYGDQLNAIDNYNALQSIARAALGEKK
jgi:regulator of protease activity HflC (stomatin/prohibitin superfamily)